MRAFLLPLCLAACSAQPVTNTVVEPAQSAPADAVVDAAPPATTNTPIAPSPTPTASNDSDLATPSATAAADTALLGRWIGVEGMFLNVARGTAPGRYRLEMQWDLDNRGTFDGALSGDPASPAITFERNGKTETLARTDGAATGLKYLADKRDCLTVRSGEGYCRR